MAIENFDEVKTYLETNAETEEVKTFFDGIKSSVETKLEPETVNSWLTEDEAGKAFAQSFTDKRVTQAVKTFEEGHFENRVAERVETEVRKRMPDETPEQKRLRELELKIEAEEQKRKHAELSQVAMQYINQKKIDGVPENLMKAFVMKTEEETRALIDSFSDFASYMKEKTANNILAKNSYTPSGGDTEKGVFATKEELNAAIKKRGNSWRQDPVLVGEYERLNK